MSATDDTDRPTTGRTDHDSRTLDAPSPCPSCGCLATRFDGDIVECSRCRRVRA